MQPNRKLSAICSFSLAAAGILGLVFLTTSAKATVIGFNALDTSAGSVAVTNQFAGLGVTFSDLIVVDGTPFFSSSPNSGVIDDGAPASLTVTATFAADVTAISAIFFDTEVGSLLVSIEAFDISDNSLGTTTVNSTAASADPTLGTLVGLSSIGAIRKVTMTTDVDGALFDDFTFTPGISGSVPEPGTLALFGFGLAGLVLARRRKPA